MTNTDKHIDRLQKQIATTQAEMKKAETAMRGNNLDMIYLLSSLVVVADGGVSDAELVDRGFEASDRADLLAVFGPLLRLLAKLQAAETARRSVKKIARDSKLGGDHGE